ncbi:MAG TPA: hypothetical protein VK698_27970 [Kofleriaceae bacterium]|nr:hypothetical protein [Kofleriaceae bacterium]
MSTRLVVAIWSLVALAPLGGSACHVGTADDGGSEAASPDAGGGDDGADDGAGDVDAAAGGDGTTEGSADECTDLSTAVEEDGYHEARFDFEATGSPGCISANCHDGSSAGGTYTVAGALYDQRASGGDPLAGATIYVTDSTGKFVKMTTAQNGFFWTDEPMTPPFKTAATGCPQLLPMISQSVNGNCNISFCHGEAVKIYLAPP